MGMVIIIAMMISVPTDQWTFLLFSAIPTPIIEDVIIWDDETGAPIMVDTMITAPEDVWESNE